MASTVISVLLVWYFFIPHRLSWQMENPSNFWSLGLFLFMGYLFSELQDRLQRANQRTEQALKETEEANQRISLLYQKTLELDELKTQFFSNVSHELRTPLTLIGGVLDKCLKERYLGEPTRRSLEVARSNSRLLYRHITDLLDLAKLEAKKMEIRYLEVDLAHLLRMAASLFEVVATSRNISYEVEAPDRLVAQADASMIQRMVLNIISNAFKFTPEQGVVRACLRQDEDNAVLEIDDSGPGIPEDMRETVFERFRQVEGHAARRHGGTGLGLAIVKEYTLLHGGWARADVSPQGGTRLIISIPLRAPIGTLIQEQVEAIDDTLCTQIIEELKPEVRAEVAGPSPTSGTAPLILVVEDNPDMNLFIQEALGTQYRVLAAYDGKEGLAMALSARPDLVINDLMMPGMSGDQMVDQLRREGEVADTPVIVHTAKMDEQLRVQMFKLGVQGYLNKPFTVEELLARVEHVLKDRQRTAESIRASEEKFATAFQRAPLMMTISSLDDGTCLEVNDTFCEISGFSREEVLGRSSVDLGWLDAQDRAVLIRDFKTQGWVRNRELIARAKDGHQVQCLFNGEIIAHRGRQMLLTVALDITDRKRTEEALRRNQKDLQESQKIAKVGSWRLTLQTNEVYWTEELYKMYGLDPNLPPPPFTEHMKLFTSESWETLSTALAKTLETGVPYELELEMVRPEGGNGWMWVRGEAICDESGKTVELWGAAQDITERRRTEATLVESEKRYRSLFENMNAGFILFEIVQDDRGNPKDLIILDANEGFETATRQRASDVIGTRLTQVLPGIESDAADWIATYGQIALTGQSRQFEQISDHLGSSYSIAAFQPGPRQCAVTFIDITERKRAEESLRQERERLAGILRGTNAGTWEWNVQTGQVIFNERWAEIIGYSLDAIAPVSIETWIKFCHPDDLKNSSDSLDRHFRGESDYYECETRMRHKNGDWVWVVDRGRVVTWTQDGKPLMMMGTHQDVTARKAIEEQVKQSEATFRVAFNSNPLAQAITDCQDGRILLVNPAYERMLRFSSAELVEQTSIQLSMWRDPAERTRLLQLMHAHGGAQHFFTDLSRKDGEVLSVRISSSAIDIFGRKCWLYILEDLTELIRAEKDRMAMEVQLRQAQKMEAIGTLAGGIAHDFNNLLASIIGYSEMVRDDSKAGKVDPRDVEQVLQAADRARMLVKQILTFSRKAETHLRPLSLNREVIQAAELLSKTIPRMTIIQTQLANDLWKIGADPNQMEQILLNLGVNASDAIGGQGTIQIKTENRIVSDQSCITCGEKFSGPYVVLEVNDTGQGMDEQTIEHIFEPFYTTKEVGKGTGLGLSTVYGIVQGHSGHISCKSTLGEGTTFTIFLPALEVVTAIANTDFSSSDDSASQGNERILLVDDEEPLLALGSRQLLKAGYKVVTANSGEAALDIFREKGSTLDLVILDLSMPGMGGYQALKELMALNPQVKVIIASGYAANEQIKDALALGAAGYVAKPFKMADMQATVRSVLDRN